MLPMDIPAILLLMAQIFFVVATIVFAVSAVDDLLIDLYFYLRLAWRKLRFWRRRYKPLAVDDLLKTPEKPFALMLPAWQESDVLFNAVSNLINTIDYRRYEVFIGVYPNDPDTQREARRLTETFANVHMVVTRTPGPTCKADCLNQIIEDIFRFEYEREMEFAGVIMQDAEDVIHPLSFRLFNHLIPRFDLVQIPVLSLPRKWHEITGGHYMDEFAEFHSKEILVREWFANVVPGAGVGTAYSRRAINFAGASGEYFSTHSLTEDYEFSFRMRDAGLKQIFARVPIERLVSETDRHGREIKRRHRDYIATREYFPNRFWPSVRQKTRWTIGISFQGWKSFGWRGDWRTKYLFWRDRKMIFFSHAIALGLASIIVFAGYNLHLRLDPFGYQLAPLIAEDSPLWWVVYFNLAVLAHRILQRHLWTWVYYGWRALPMVVPRYIWGAVINYLAITRATRIYLRHLLTGEPIGWDKTAHDFPEDDNLTRIRQRLGDILLERGYIGEEDLAAALAAQKDSGKPLGSILVEMGLLNQQDLEYMLEIQSGVRAVRRAPPVAAAGEAEAAQAPASPTESAAPAAGPAPTAAPAAPSHPPLPGDSTRYTLFLKYLLKSGQIGWDDIKAYYAEARAGRDQPIDQYLIEKGLISTLIRDFFMSAVDDQHRFT